VRRVRRRRRRRERDLRRDLRRGNFSSLAVKRARGRRIKLLSTN